MTAEGGDDDDTLNVLSSVRRSVTVLGGNGNDTLIGGRGSDTLKGGAGDDRYVFRAATSAEADLVTELANQGTDTLTFNSATAAVNLNLGTSSVQTVHVGRTLRLNSDATVENVYGGSGADFLRGNARNNLLNGGTGHDILVGENGNDQLVGGTGRDILIVGDGERQPAAESDGRTRMSLTRQVPRIHS